MNLEALQCLNKAEKHQHLISILRWHVILYFLMMSVTAAPLAVYPVLYEIGESLCISWSSSSLIEWPASWIHTSSDPLIFRFSVEVNAPFFHRMIHYRVTTLTDDAMTRFIMELLYMYHHYALLSLQEFLRVYWTRSHFSPFSSVSTFSICLWRRGERNASINPSFSSPPLSFCVAVCACVFRQIFEVQFECYTAFTSRDIALLERG